MKIKLLILILITTNCLTWPDKPTLFETLEKIKKPALIDLNGNPIKPMEDHKVVRNHPKICEPFSNSENLLNVNETGFKLLLDFTLISSELPESGSKQSSLGYKNFKHPKEKPFLPSGFSSHLNIKDPELEQFIIHTIVKTKGHDTAEVRAVNILLKGKKAFANSKDMLLWIKLLKKFIK